MNNSPNITGMAVKDINNDIEQSQPDYSLDLDIKGELRSLKLSGVIIGTGHTKVVLSYDSGELIVVDENTDSDITLEETCKETCDMSITSEKFTLLFYLEDTKLNLKDVTYLFPKSEKETIVSEVQTKKIQITE